MERGRTDFDLTWPALLTGVVLALACLAPGLSPSEPRRTEKAVVETAATEPAAMTPERSEPAKPPNDLDLLKADLESQRKEVVAQRAALLMDIRRLVKVQGDAQQADKASTERRSQLAGKTLISRADLEKQRVDLMQQIAEMQQRATRLRKQMIERKTAPPSPAASPAKASSGTQYVECLNGAVVLTPQGTRFSVMQLRARDAAYVEAVKGNSVSFLVHPLGFSSFQAARELAESSGVKSVGYEPVEGAAP